MANLANFSGPGLIIPQLRGEDPASVIDELVAVMQSDHGVMDATAFRQAVLRRESMGATDLELGMAFPHARQPGLKEVALALGRRAEPLRWRSHAAPSVRLVFLLAIPDDDVTRYLSLLSGLARLSKDTRLVAQLMEAANAVEMLAVLRGVNLGGSAPADSAGTRMT